MFEVFLAPLRGTGALSRCFFCKDLCARARHEQYRADLQERPRNRHHDPGRPIATSRQDTITNAGRIVTNHISGPEEADPVRFICHWGTREFALGLAVLVAEGWMLGPKARLAPTSGQPTPCPSRFCARPDDGHLAGVRDGDVTQRARCAASARCPRSLSRSSFSPGLTVESVSSAPDGYRDAAQAFVSAT